MSGIVQAIDKAHRDLKPGSIAIGKGELLDASNNRSLPAYMRNPQAERERWGRPIDPEMTVLRFKQGSADVGVISWFATHGVSMSPTNHLLSPDNKGYAAWRWEHELKGVRYNADSDFVAAFAQSNAGDMTPNLNLDGTGPTANRIRQHPHHRRAPAAKALAIYNGALEPIAGPLDYRQRFIDFSRVSVAPQFADGAARSTCPAALGTAFAVGTEDGRGLDGFNEGDLAGNAFFQALGGIITLPPAMGARLPWRQAGAAGYRHPATLPLVARSAAHLGHAHRPAGDCRRARRIYHHGGTARARYRARRAWRQRETHRLHRYANAYSGYVTTPEEYEAQHYEGASTHFGKWTLGAYQQSFHELASAAARER
ncbi:neutral/alkaline non-lysosomal ceramidase N-terminal domain-containing protein [Massilia sp. B-10]|nr:neutral/alkaline non-lysosomal ceramidase N-terminal domain-containing protein [Massilia sp. B-10]